jgi:Phosphatidylinositolglycan class N (PIG-N)
MTSNVVSRLARDAAAVATSKNAGRLAAAEAAKIAQARRSGGGATMDANSVAIDGGDLAHRRPSVDGASLFSASPFSSSSVSLPSPISRCRLKRWHVIMLVSALFHVLCFVGVRDLYFRTLLVHNVPITEWTPIGEFDEQSTLESCKRWQHARSPADDARTTPAPWEDPPARRIVAVLADGLRFDKLTKLFPDDGGAQVPRALSGKPVAPFLRERVERDGVMAMAMARAPTESRPGHAALLAGTYEDPGILGRRLSWAHFIEPFDSVFNHTRAARFYVGTHGDSLLLEVPRALFDAYHPGASRVFEPAAGIGKQRLEWSDYWAFEAFEADLFRQVRRRRHTDDDGSGGEALYWIDLQAIDQVKSPASMNYLHMVAHMDAAVERISATVERLFPDGRTAFVILSDHGRHDEGWHGDDSKVNTYTPLLAWGAGIAKPQLLNESVVDPEQDRVAAYYRAVSDDYRAHWDLSHLQLHALNQVDVAPLLSALLGVPIPTQSVGVLPADLIDAEPAYVAKAALVNTRQIYNLYRRKVAVKAEATRFFFPYAPLFDIEHSFARIERLICQREFDAAVVLAHDTAILVLYGIDYIDTYDRFFTLVLLSCCYVGWVLCIVAELSSQHILLANGQRVTVAPSSSSAAPSTTSRPRRIVIDSDYRDGDGDGDDELDDPKLSALMESTEEQVHMYQHPTSGKMMLEHEVDDDGLPLSGRPSSSSLSSASSSCRASHRRYTTILCSIFALVCAYIYVRGTYSTLEYVYAVCGLAFWREVGRRRSRLWRVLLLGSLTTTPTCSSIVVPSAASTLRRRGSLPTSSSSSSSIAGDHQNEFGFYGSTDNNESWFRNVATLPSLFLLMLAIVQVGFSHRGAFALIYAMLAGGSFLFLTQIDTSVRRKWCISCFWMAVWFLFSDHYAPNASFSAATTAFVAVWYAQRALSTLPNTRARNVFLTLKMALMGVVFALTYFVEYVPHGTERHYGVYVLAYATCVLGAFVLPFWSIRLVPGQWVMEELLFALSFPMLLLSIAHESIFYFLLAQNAIWWFLVEQQLRLVHLASSMRADASSSGISNFFVSTEIKAKVRVAFFFLLFLSVALLGARSLDSLAFAFGRMPAKLWRCCHPFPAWFRFAPKFRGVSLMLLVAEITVPIVFVCAVLVLVLRFVWTNFSRRRILLLAIGLSDILAVCSLTFIHSTRSSWSDIAVTVLRFAFQNFGIWLLIAPLLSFVAFLLRLFLGRTEQHR